MNNERRGFTLHGSSKQKQNGSNPDCEGNLIQRTGVAIEKTYFEGSERSQSFFFSLAFSPPHIPPTHQIWSYFVLFQSMILPTDGQSKSHIHFAYFLLNLPLSWKE